MLESHFHVFEFKKLISNDNLNSFSFVGEVISKNRASYFIGVSKHSKTIKALGLRPRAFISFLMFGNPDEALALVFEILRKELYMLARRLLCSHGKNNINILFLPLKHKIHMWPQCNILCVCSVVCNRD